MKVHEYSDKYFGVFNCSTSRSRFDLTVIHSTETEDAEATARGLSQRSDASSHLVTGPGVTFRGVPEKFGACTVREPNPWTLNIEQTGRARWRKRRWLKKGNWDTIKRTAYWVAHWSLKYDIPPVFRSTKDLDAGKTRGWTTHAAIAASKLSSSTHTDPGAGYPLFGRVSFAALLRFYRAGRILKLIPGPKQI